MLMLSLSILAVALWTVVRWFQTGGHDSAAAIALLASAAVGFTLGALLRNASRRDSANLGRREAMLLVSTAWLAGAALAALPFFLWAYTQSTASEDHPFRSYLNCYFEAMSGLTTTGATIIGDGHRIAELPAPLLLWRALTQWLGGLGIVVLFVAVLPTLGVGGKKLFQAETPGPRAAGVKPRIRETARLLWLIYLGLTLALVAALCGTGLDPFDAICHTFTTVASGGFSTRDSSIAEFTITQQSIIVLFMVLSGVNFGIFHLIISGRFKQALTDVELRLYLGILLVGSLAVAWSLANQGRIQGEGDAGFAVALRHGVVQTVAIQTSTGFCVTDFDRWHFAPKAILVLLMFIGASAGSTGGGVKIIRLLIAAKVFVAEIERIFRPNVVRPIKIGGSPVDFNLRLSTMVYLLTILVIFATGTLVIMALETGRHCDLTTAATACIATLNNIGPGLSRVGAVEHYGWFSAPSKIVLITLMALGRLELYALLVLLTPRFWHTQ